MSSRRCRLMAEAVLLPRAMACRRRVCLRAASLYERRLSVLA